MIVCDCENKKESAGCAHRNVKYQECCDKVICGECGRMWFGEVEYKDVSCGGTTTIYPFHTMFSWS